MKAIIQAVLVNVVLFAIFAAIYTFIADWVALFLFLGYIIYHSVRHKGSQHSIYDSDGD